MTYTYARREARLFFPGEERREAHWSRRLDLRRSRKLEASDPAIIEFTARFECEAAARERRSHLELSGLHSVAPAPGCDVEIGHRSATVCHLGNIALRLGESLAVGSRGLERFLGNMRAKRDALEADALALEARGLSRPATSCRHADRSRGNQRSVTETGPFLGTSSNRCGFGLAFWRCSMT